MCEPMWILASFQSTSDPFIQILPVPGKAIVLLLQKILYGPSEGENVRLAIRRKTGISTFVPGAACGSASRSQAAGCRANAGATESRRRWLPAARASQPGG